MRRLAALPLVAGLMLSACAPKTVPLPPASAAPRFPDFLRPAVPAALAGTPAAVNHDRAWYFLQAGDLRNAEREIQAVLKAVPTFFPAEASAGYLELARQDPLQALTRFDRALAGQPDYAPALVGKGQAYLSTDREPEALAAFEAALAADPSLADVRRRVEVLRFRSVERNLAAAREAAGAGRTEEALKAYANAIASSPDSPFLYRELAGVERQNGDLDGALRHLRKAVELEPGDTASLAQIGDILEGRGDLDGAIDAYEAVLGVEPNADVEAKRDAVRARIELSRLPEEYRAIAAAPQVTRGDLAALIGVRLAPVLQTLRTDDASVLTDVRAHWAEPWIMTVARAGVIEPFANHTFQPRTPVRRADLAQAVLRLLSRAAPPAQVQAWQASRSKFNDISTNHLAYAAASLSVAAGVMAPTPDGAFQPSRLVTGQEAVAAAERLQALLGTRQQALAPR
jgi:tetratricopeptide (TPR) repeat protein